MTSKEVFARLEWFYLTLRRLLNLRADMDEERTVENIRENVDFRSANAWTLVFAIFVASIGLNTNSAAVIIGAMLISPLMGPIVGSGLALGVNDFELLKRSALNLVYAVGISVFTSTCYFVISPLSEIQSELLARTRPTFYDVLIAIFGGAAGIVAVSRKEKGGNAVAGVAIATALMPPLCTAGFGFARLEPKYFLGAIYLFVINSVFICLSTYVFVRYMKFKRVKVTDVDHQKRINRWILLTASVVILPSLVLAWFLQRETLFRSRAMSFVNKEMRFERSFVVGTEIIYGWRESKISVSLIGESLPASEVDLLKEKIKRYSLEPKNLEIRQASLEESLEKRMSEKFNTESNLIHDYEVKLSQRELELQTYHAAEDLSTRISSELTLLFTDVRKVIVLAQKVANSEYQNHVIVQWKIQPKKEEREKVTQFLEQRAQVDPSLVSHMRDLEARKQ
ncbi:MAG: TIGR00341 family protein [Bdellovibrionales bacterium]